jgi:hypothetical protein
LLAPVSGRLWEVRSRLPSSPAERVACFVISSPALVAAPAEFLATPAIPLTEGMSAPESAGEAEGIGALSVAGLIGT